MRIGFIGLGAMGLPMGRNLAGAAGVDVTYYDVRADVLEQVAGLGAVAGSIGELVAGVDAIFTVLPADEHVRAVGEEIARAARPGQAYVDFSTIHPGTIAEVAKRLDAVGVETVGVALTRSTAAAQAGTLALYLGGPAAWIDDLAPAWDAISSERLVLAGPGAAKALKVINNMVVSAIDTLVSEAIVLAAKLGVPAAETTAALGAGGADSWALREHIERYLLPEDLGPGRFSTRYMAKDVRICAQLARSVGLPAFFAGLSRAYYRGSLAHGRGDDYHMIAIRLMEELANLGRPATSPPPAGHDAAPALDTIAAAAAAAQTLISLEALALAERSAITPGQAGLGMETGSGGNESLTRLVASVDRDGQTIGQLAAALDAVEAIAESADVPALAFEIAGQLARALGAAHGFDADVRSLVTDASGVA